MSELSPLRIVVHIGLHKTATRFFQNFVFAQLKSASVLFNPPALMTPLHALYRDPSAEGAKEMVLLALAELRHNGQGKCLLISKPDIPGEMYDGYPEHPEYLALLKELMPEAQILYVARYPVDWLHSAYRQSLVKGRGGPIETFLNFRGGSFNEKRAVYANGMRNIDARRFPVRSIYDHCVELFGRDRVVLMCFEHVRGHKERVLECLRELIGLEQLPDLQPDRVKNRSYSAQAIERFCSGGPTSFEPISFSDDGPSNLYWTFWLKPLRKLRANFIKHGFDRVIYRDWDLISRGGMREQLDELYQSEYEQLLAISQTLLTEKSA